MTEKQNKHLMQLVRRVHGLLENDDLQKQRDSQNQLASILTNSKNFIFDGFDVNNLYFEWTDYCQRLENSENNDKIIFYCHGGGYMTGSCLYARELTTKLAKQTMRRVFCFDYRLAPEHPYPAAVEDALAAWEYIISQGYYAENIIMAGDSAGGNLALALTLSLKDKALALPRALVLFSPWTDMTLSSESYSLRGSVDPVLNTEYIKKAAENYLNGADCRLPMVSPLFADLSGFPPVYIQVGDNEILLDDSRKLYSRLLSDNVFARLDVFSNMWHVFQMTPVKAAQTAMGKVSDFIENLG